MTSSELVSVIIPCYNGRNLVGAALESIAAQTYKNWELIMVEDGTNDGTEEMLKRFAANHPTHRIVYIRHSENKGVSATRNTAILATNGVYVAEIDQDDMWRPKHLECSLAVLEEQGADIAFSAASTCDLTSGEIQEPPILFPTQDTFGESLVARNFITHSSVVIKRTALEAVGLYDTASVMQLAEDYDMWLRFLNQGKKFAAIHERNVIIRKHPQQATGSNVDLDKAYATGCALWSRHAQVNGVPRHITRKRASDAHIACAMHLWSKSPSQTAALLMQALRFCPWRKDGWKLLFRAACLCVKQSKELPLLA